MKLKAAARRPDAAISDIGEQRIDQRLFDRELAASRRGATGRTTGRVITMGGGSMIDTAGCCGQLKTVLQRIENCRTR